MKLQQIRHLVSTEQQAVDKLIIDSLHSEVPLIEQIGHYIVNSGGKRLRPLIVLLSALACGYRERQHIDLAAIIEFIHTATLLHDDVIDKSTLRRGQATANAIWNDHSSVLVGDFLYSRAFQMMVQLDNMQVLQIIADTTNTISEGEVLQLLNTNDAATDEKRYFNVIKRKTAILFATSSKLGAVISNSDATLYKALNNYGLNFGVAYQLIDDILDYRSEAKNIGKNIGDDLAEGKPTLPLIYLLQYGSAEQGKIVRNAITHGKLKHLKEIQQAIDDSGAIAYTLKTAQQYADRANDALQCLPGSDYKQVLSELVELLLQQA